MKHRVIRKKRTIRVVFLTIITIFIVCLVALAQKKINKKIVENNPERVLKTYMNCISEKKYAEMYEMITAEARK